MEQITINRSSDERVVVDRESRLIEGYAIVFNRESVVMYDPDGKKFFREVIAPTAIDNDLLLRSDVVCRLGHNPDKVLARSRNGQGTLKLEVDEHGLRYSFSAPNTSAGDEAIELISRGDIYGSSFFGMVKKDALTWSRDDQGAKCVVNKIEMLRDVSPVVYPAYECTDVIVREMANNALMVPKKEEPAKYKKCKPLKSIF